MSAEAPEHFVKALTAIDEQITFVVGHPDMSEWLKHTLNTALGRPPTALLNDLEILNQILRRRSELLLSNRVCDP